MRVKIDRLYSGCVSMGAIGTRHPQIWGLKHLAQYVPKLWLVKKEANLN